jgi:hypothetical protein
VGAQAGKADPCPVEAVQRRRQRVERDPELRVGGTRREVLVGLGVDLRVQPQADPRASVVAGQLEQSVQLVERLGIDQDAGAKGQVQLLVPLPDAVHDDPVRGAARAMSQGHLDRGDHLAAGAVGHQAAQKLRIRVGLDRVGDQRVRKGRLPVGEARRGGVQVGDVEGSAPAQRGLGKQLGRSCSGHPSVAPLRAGAVASRDVAEGVVT